MIWGATAAGIGGRLEAVALSAPQPVAGIAGARTIAAGEFLFGAIDAAGTIFTWGLNTDGALGRPTTHFNAMPGPIVNVPPASTLASGKGYMLAGEGS